MSKKREYLTIPEAAKLLGISRIALYRKVKSGKIRARKIGRVYAIAKDAFSGSEKRRASESEKRRVDAAVRRTVKEYGETLRLLGRE